MLFKTSFLTVFALILFSMILVNAKKKAYLRRGEVGDSNLNTRYHLYDSNNMDTGMDLEIPEQENLQSSTNINSPFCSHVCPRNSVDRSDCLHRCHKHFSLPYDSYRNKR